MNAKDIAGSAPLHWACFNGHIDIVRLLIEHGADMNAKNDWGSTPLHWACLYGPVDIVRLLIAHGADVNMKNVNENGAWRR